MNSTVRHCFLPGIVFLTLLYQNRSSHLFLEPITQYDSMASPLNGEVLSRASTNVEDGAWLGILANGFRRVSLRTFLMSGYSGCFYNTALLFFLLLLCIFSLS